MALTVVKAEKKNVDVKSDALKQLRQESIMSENRNCPLEFMAVSRADAVFADWIPRKKPRDIVVLSPYDCEDDLLLLKAEVMGPHASVIVVGEPEFSNSHRPRTMCFNTSIADAYSAASKNNRDALSLVYLTIPGAVSDFQYWEQEVHLRNQLALEFIQDNRTVQFMRELQDDTFIILTDMDEIISGEHMRMLRWFDHPRGLTAFRISLRWTYYGFEWVNPNPWEMNSIVSWAQLRSDCKMQANNIRLNLCEISTFELLPMIGWHCSWCFADTRQFIRKIENSAHSEYDQPRYKDLAFLKEQRSRGLWFVDSQPNGCFDENASAYI